MRIRTLITALLVAFACAPALAADDNAAVAPTLPTASPANVSTPAPLPVPTATPGLSSTGAFSLTAQRIAFYDGRYILTADGNVEVKLADGARVTGNRFAMDLRLNRFVIAGNVKLSAAGQEYDGAAFSDFFDFDRQYFVPVGDDPDRWTYAHGDYSRPYRGRAMPGDAFFLPDLSRDAVYVTSRKCVVQPRESIKFITPTFYFGPARLPWPSFFLNFSANPNFAQNSMPGAFGQLSYDAFGGGHSLVTANLRYDQSNKVYLAAEIHQVSDKHYIVASGSPLTRPFKVYNFDVYDRLSPQTQVHASFQESAFQLALHTPFSASAYSNLKVTGGLPHSYLELNANQYWTSLLAQPAPGVLGLLYYSDPTHNWIPNHPNDLQLTWNGFRNRVNKLPLFVTLRSGIGVAHEGYGLAALGGVVSPTVWFHTVGANVSAPSIALIKDDSGFRRDVYLNLSFDKQRQWYDLPHHVDTTVWNASLSRQFSPHFSGLLSYTNTNTGDFWGARQNELYPLNQSYFSMANNQVYPSYGAFDGFATTRSLAVQLNYTASTSFAANVSLRRNHDFPETVPGVLNTYGSLIYPNYGVVPTQATLEVRFRVSPALVLDFQNAYFFNFAGLQRWSPNFQIQASR